MLIKEPLYGDSLIEKGCPEPALTRLYYKEWYDNEKIAKDAALFKAGYSNTLGTRSESFGHLTGFKFGDYLNYKVKFVDSKSKN